jgi:hypothetical protein
MLGSAAVTAIWEKPNLGLAVGAALDALPLLLALDIEEDDAAGGMLLVAWIGAPLGAAGAAPVVTSAGSMSGGPGPAGDHARRRAESIHMAGRQTTVLHGQGTAFSVEQRDPATSPEARVHRSERALASVLPA